MTDMDFGAQRQQALMTLLNGGQGSNAILDAGRAALRSAATGTNFGQQYEAIQGQGRDRAAQMYQILSGEEQLRMQRESMLFQQAQAEAERGDKSIQAILDFAGRYEGTDPNQLRSVIAKTIEANPNSLGEAYQVFDQNARQLGVTLRRGDDLPEGMRLTPDGGLEFLPGYVEGKATLAAATRAPEKPQAPTAVPGMTGYIYGTDAQGNPVAQPLPGAPAPGPDLDVTKQLRGEFTKITEDFRQAKSGFEKVQAAAQDESGAGDMALVFGLMKTLDPNSTVREGEFATAEQTGGVPAYVVNTYNRLLTGQRLTPEQRQQFVQTAGSQYQVYQRTYGQYQNIYRGLAERSGVRPEDVVLDFAGTGDQPAPAAQAQPGAAPGGGPMPDRQNLPRPTTQQGFDALPRGALYIDPDDGQVYRKP